MRVRKLLGLIGLLLLPFVYALIIMTIAVSGRVPQEGRRSFHSFDNRFGMDIACGGAYFGGCNVRLSLVGPPELNNVQGNDGDDKNGDRQN